MNWEKWLKRAAWFCGAIMTIGGCLFVTLTFARGQVAAPIEAKLDQLAVRDSVRAANEKTERIYGDAAVSEKLDLVIRLLTKRGR